MKGRKNQGGGGGPARGRGTRRADLTLFEHLMRRPEETFDLAQGALLVAEPSYPGLDIAYYVGVLDKLGDEARRRVAGLSDGDGEARARRLLRLLFDEVGFQGNVTDYYDPRNSFLNEVLERRLGIPLTLSLVLMEVARRGGIPAHGVNFPGHFLVGIPAPHGTLYVDAFEGRLLSAAELRALYAQYMHVEGDPDPRFLQPASKRDILARMLRNLREIYQNRSDREALRPVLERLRVLTPEDDDVGKALDQIDEDEGTSTLN